MQSKGAIRIVTIGLVIASIWQLSFTAVTALHNKKAEKRAEQKRKARNRAATEAVGTLLSPVFGKTTGKKIARGIFGTLR